MTDITNSVCRKAKDVHQINKSARKCHVPKNCHERKISRKKLKMLSPESDHFEVQIVIKIFHTLSRIKCSNNVPS